jgi:cardiolipin synthase
LAAIAAAKTSIALSVYIFDLDDVGRSFIAALKEAHTRGVKVLVLVDEIGSGKLSRAADEELAEAGITTARFIPQKIKFLPIVNLRNHRKLMMIDGVVGYIGGMNIARNYSGDAAETVRDIHFRVEGAVLEQMSAVFEEDWRFASGVTISLPDVVHDESALGLPQYARIVPDGPDNAFQRTLWILLGALALSQKSVHILTPFFLPNDALTYALSICALRGVDVRVVVPEETDTKLVDWAMTAKFPALLEHGVKIFRSRKPFDHSKLMVVDESWMLVGSSNWDQRSLRLNFEANMEIYDEGLAAQMERHFQTILQISKPVSLRDVNALPVLTRLRNNIARLFTPYL